MKLGETFDNIADLIDFSRIGDTIGLLDEGSYVERNQGGGCHFQLESEK